MTKIFVGFNGTLSGLVLFVVGSLAEGFSKHNLFIYLNARENTFEFRECLVLTKCLRSCTLGHYQDLRIAKVKSKILWMLIIFNSLVGRIYGIGNICKDFKKNNSYKNREWISFINISSFLFDILQFLKIM